MFTEGIFPPDKLYPPDYNYYFNNDPSKRIIKLKIKDNIGFKNPTSLIINFKQVGGEEKEIRAGQIYRIRKMMMMMMMMMMLLIMKQLSLLKRPNY